MRNTQERLNLIMDRIEDSKFLKSSGLGNEIGFWVFDYPAQHELLVREHLDYLTAKLNKRGYQFAHLNVFSAITEMLENRQLLERTFQREKEIGPEGILKALSGPLNQKKIADFIAEKIKPETLSFILISGLGSAWPLVRGHALFSALQDVMGSTPVVLFYPGEYSGHDLHPFGLIESRNYYRAFKLVPEDGNTQSVAST